jgi:hypothetical protein
MFALHSLRSVPTIAAIHFVYAQSSSPAVRYRQMRGQPRLSFHESELLAPASSGLGGAS